MNILLIHLAATSFMTGLIWIIQIVHYQSFRFIAEANFREFEKFHCNRITPIVMPAMLLELGSALYILAYLDQDNYFAISFALLILIWISTFFIQSLIHGKLLTQFSQSNIELLIKTNWVRTALWSTRLLILFFNLVQ